MGNEVYANAMEVACKAAAGKSICAFPDVCFTPPQTPATPPGVPIPYPNTGMASDCSGGSTTVKVSGQEVMLKNKSFFKRSSGNEAGCAPKKGLMTSKNMGKIYFVKWSMDVKFEGQNVVRHLDMATHNHGSYPSNTAPWVYADAQALAPGGKCHDEAEAVDKKCNPADKWKERCPTPPAPMNASKPAKNASAATKAVYRKKVGEHHKAWGAYAQKVKKDDCLNARKCMLVPYQDKDKAGGCCPGQTPDHLIDAASFLKPGTRGSGSPEPIKGWSGYDEHKAPCACAEGPSYYIASHGQLHTRKGVVAVSKRNKKRMWKRKDATQAGAKALSKTFPKSGCSPACTEAQLNKYHDSAKDRGGEQDIRAAAPMGKEGRAAAATEMGVSAPTSHP
jgi:hypothetical protein